MGWPMEKIVLDQGAPLEAVYRLVKGVKHNVPLPKKMIYEASAYLRLDPDMLRVYAENNVDLMARIYALLKLSEDSACR
jgi:hypothetical protein